ncbi:MotB family protein [Marinobacter zhanjiangensis]|uniref:Flagellar motor protein MotB n=1 Tax=Marinobacter zhanjiangensis TaxID=578215 RepID=A0ABQ3B614_9GAMM|nr:MotB family protein [Marinobacter zhanjiangensis]GGY80841.1 flagellar motor protein MotB [Marinobacter zhanjiangensis]
MDELPEEEKPGIPAWVVTFADLMSLLMCFFVLLLSFSEIDAMKFKQIAEEMSKAFGVQREVASVDIPQGTSPVFRHFTPGKPEPTDLDEVRQSTTEVEPFLDREPGTQPGQQAAGEATAAALAYARSLEAVLQEEITAGQLDVQADPGKRQIIMRIEERGSFSSGSAELTYAMVDLLYRMSKVLTDIPGDLTVEGHTDNVPIGSGSRYESNWNLSADRAAAVANALIEAGPLDEGRFRVMGLASTEPRRPNDSRGNRALNRRVEIIVDLSDDPGETPTSLKELPPDILVEPDNTPAPSADTLTW